jgi:hypothetical protein
MLAGCAGRPEPEQEAPDPALVANTGQLTIHIKGFT